MDDNRKHTKFKNHSGANSEACRPIERWPDLGAGPALACLEYFGKRLFNQGEIQTINKIYFISGEKLPQVLTFFCLSRLWRGKWGPGQSPDEKKTNASLSDVINGGLFTTVGNSNTSVPRAFLNHILFDETLVFVDAGFISISSSPGASLELLALDDITINQNGFIYIYVSNESNVNINVFFDDLKVTHYKSEIVQTDDYYPFGLTLAGTAYKRMGERKNSFLFNKGTELIDDLNLNLYQTHKRFLDPMIGRFWGVDALADVFPTLSPMAFGYNSPIYFNDPVGLSGTSSDTTYVLPEIVITASRVETDYSFLQSWLWNSNPIKRYVGSEYSKGGIQRVADLWNNNRSIHWGEGLGYTTEFTQGLYKLGEGFSLAFGGLILATYGSPVLMETIGKAGLKFAGGFAQDVSTQLITGTKLSQIDYSDAFIGGVIGPFKIKSLEYFGFEMLKSVIDIRIGLDANGLNFNKSTALFAGKSIEEAEIDVGMGALRSFGNLRLHQDYTDKAVINTINSMSSTSTDFVGDKIKDVLNK